MHFTSARCCGDNLSVYLAHTVTFDGMSMLMTSVLIFLRQSGADSGGTEDLLGLSGKLEPRSSIEVYATVGVSPDCATMRCND